jgi:serine/threonine protein kinase
MDSHRASIDDFKILTLLGKGSFAKVFLVRHKTTQQVFAMKALPKKSVSAKKQ